MRRTAAASALAALVLALPLVDASAGERCGRRAHVRGCGHYGYVVPARPFEAWRAYYDAQAEVSWARRAAAANYYVATGRPPPGRYAGPPTNYYAEAYALHPYMYFACPLARRGEGVCPQGGDFFNQ